MNCDKTQVVTKLKLWQNTNFDKNQFVTSQIMTTFKLWQKSNCEEKNKEKTQGDKTQIVTELENSNNDNSKT